MGESGVGIGLLFDLPHSDRRESLYQACSGRWQRVSEIVAVRFAVVDQWVLFAALAADHMGMRRGNVELKRLLLCAKLRSGSDGSRRQREIVHIVEDTYLENVCDKRRLHCRDHIRRPYVRRIRPARVFEAATCYDARRCPCLWYQ